MTEQISIPTRLASEIAVFLGQCPHDQVAHLVGPLRQAAQQQITAAVAEKPPQP